MSFVSGSVIKLPVKVIDRARVELTLGPDKVRVTLLDSGVFHVETKTGFGSKFVQVFTGNVGDGDCAACGGPHARGEKG